MKKYKKIINKYMKKHWGPRCGGYCPNCCLCEAWKAADVLTGTQTPQVNCCDDESYAECLEQSQPLIESE